jgi:hypothetical protein
MELELRASNMLYADKVRITEETGFVIKLLYFTSWGLGSIP